MYILFEDKLVINKEKKQYVGVSYLIAEAYKNTDITVIFAESNAGLKVRLKDLVYNIEDDSFILVFVDLVADNQNTWGLYSRLVDIACESKQAIVCIVPVPCIEYFYLIAFNKMITERSDYEKMLKKEHYTKTNVYAQGFLKSNDSSFEKFCKCVRRTYLPYDANKTSFNMEDKSFYNSYIGKLNEPLDITQKGWAIVQKLPIYYECEDNTCIKTEQMNLVEIINKLYNEFEEQAVYYNNIGFDVGKVLRVRRKYEQHKKYLMERISKL